MGVAWTFAHRKRLHHFRLLLLLLLQQQLQTNTNHAYMLCALRPRCSHASQLLLLLSRRYTSTRIPPRIPIYHYARDIPAHNACVITTAPPGA
jgi:hypothetical protein